MAEKQKDSSGALALWKERYDRARAAYEPELKDMQRREQLYLGAREIRTPTGTAAAKDATNVRNIVFELVESQISSVIPQPKVTAIHRHNQQNARSIEDKLRGELDRLPMEVLNDLQERTTLIQGSSMLLVEWDSSMGGHNTAGELTVRLLHPRQVIPQPGVYELQEMDYVFVELTQSREALRRRYGVEIEGGTLVGEDGAGNEEELVTQVTVYYRGESGSIGRFSWVDGQVLEDLEDYLARRLRICSGCGRVKRPGESRCSCGSRSFEEQIQRMEIPGAPIRREGKEAIPAMSGSGSERRPVSFPYYQMSRYPIAVRKNVSLSHV